MSFSLDPDSLGPTAGADRANAITRIDVEGLFGRFTYHLDLPAAPSADLARMMILYGDNGSGKTTILRAIFHLISSGNNKGHRTYLGGVIFSRLSVAFSNGLTLSAARPAARKGTFRLHLAQGGDDISTVEVHVADDGRVKGAENPHLSQFERHLDDLLPQDIYYIGDDRRLESDSLPPTRRHREARSHQLRGGRQALEGVVWEDDNDLGPQADLQLTIERAIEWLRRQAIRASNLGNQSSNQIYADVLKRIATPTLLDDPSTPSIDEAKERLIRLAERNEQYHRFGLVPAFDSDMMLTAASAVSETRRDAFLSVLLPFVNGLEARLDALGSLYDAIDAYVDAINSFLMGKSLSVVLPRDILIHSSDGQVLQPHSLSSGERQLLLILTNTLFAHERPGVFIIDEPELSLNMKWQRRLIDAFLSTTRGTATQFLLATHSFEVMTSARDRVLHLVPYDVPATLPYDEPTLDVDDSPNTDIAESDAESS